MRLTFNSPRGCAITAFILATAVPSQSMAQTDGFVRKTRTITPRVHLVYRPIPTNAPFEGNSIVIEQSSGLVVIDAGGASPAGKYIVESIRTLSPKPVKFLVYTHYHGDHNLGAGAFLKTWPGVSIISTDATRANMTGKPMEYIKTYGSEYAKAVEFAKKQIADPKTGDDIRRGWQQFVDVGPSMAAGYRNLRSYPATLTFSERLTISDSETSVQLLFLGRANTDGDAVVWIPTERVLCAGDIVVNPIPYAAASYPGEWVGVLKKLEQFDFAVLIPGHGEPLPDHAYVHKLVAALEDVQVQVTPLAQSGVSLEDVYNRTNFERLTTTFAGDDQWLRRFMNSVFLRSIIKNAYFEATGQAIVQGTSWYLAIRRVSCPAFFS